MKRFLCAAILTLSVLGASGCSNRTGPQYALRWVNVEGKVETATSDEFATFNGGTMRFFDEETKRYRYIHSERWEVSQN